MKPNKNKATIEVSVWGINCCSKINEIVSKIKAVNIPDMNITDVELYFLLN